MTKYIVFTGHTSSGITLHNGDTLSTFGMVTSTTVSGGGIDYVFAGGTASFTTVLLGGNEYVSSGGTAISTTVSNGGTQRVYSSGTTSFTTLSNGSEDFVYHGGAASLTTVSSGGFEVVSGGTVVSTMVDSSGTEDVLSGGTASFTTVSYGGTLEVRSSGTAIFAMLSGGTENVSAHGTAISTTVSRYGSEVVSTGGVASFTTVDDGGYQEVYGGTAIDATVDGGYQTLSLGGTATSTTVNTGGYETVSAGGKASFTAVDAGGAEYVDHGGSAVSTTVSDGGSDYVYSAGETSFTTVSSGGYESVESSGTASFTTLDSGGTGYVSYGGTAISTTARSGSTEYALSSGTTSFTTVDDGATEFVNSNGAAVSTTVNSSGYEVIFDGGSASFTTVSSGGLLVVLPGGNQTGTTGGGLIVSTGVVVYAPATGISVYGPVANGVAVSGGGTEFILPGGTASFTTVSNGGTDDVYSGGAAISATLSGGTEIVFASGTTTGTTVSSGGEQMVESGGITVSTSVDFLGEQDVVNGATVSDTTLAYGAQQHLSGTAAAISTTLQDGGNEYVSTGAVVSFTTAIGDGQDYIEAGGSAVSTTVVSGGGETVFGLATLTTVSSGGTQYVYDGGTTVSTLIDPGGTQFVHSNGTAISTAVDSGGVQVVESGGRTSFTTVSNGDFEVVFPGGLAVSTTVLAGGTFVVLPGGAQIGTTGPIDSSGVVVVQPSSGVTVYDHVASGVTVSAGGNEYVLAAGSAVSTTVGNGGDAYVYAGGTATGTVVNYGGFEAVSSGGAATGTTVSNNGEEKVYDGATASFTTISAGGTEQVDLGATVLGATLSGGFQLLSGGFASDTTVDGGTEYMVSYALAVSTTVDDGGFQIVSGGYEYFSAYGGFYPVDGGTTSYTTVNSGGTEEVQDFSTAISTTVNNGGAVVVEVEYAENEQGTASFTTVNSGGVEVMNGGFATSTTVNLGGSIDFRDLTYSTGGTAFVDANDVLSVTVDGTTETQQLAGTYYASENFVLAAGPAAYGGTEATLEGTACYCRGTLILTETGEIAVEDLHIGDRVVTLSGMARPIRWIGRRSYAGRFAAGNRNVLPILIRGNAFSPGAPRRDLLVSPLHAMFLDGVLIPASALVNGTSIVQLEVVEQVEYFHIELETHDVILAEGAPSETFADDDSRGMFHNAAEYRLLYPDVPRAPVRFCAPRVEDGAALEAVRLRLAARAGAAGTDAASVGTLRGHLDQVGHDRITGWARDMAAPDRPVRLRILDNDVTIGEVVADSFRADLLRRGVGDGHHGFDVNIDGGLSPFLRHVIRVQRAADGQDLPASPWMLDAAPLVLPAPAEADGRLRGHLDVATRERIAGWAQDAADAATPVALQILDNGLLIARVLANRGRADLADAGIGSGRHGFDLIIPGGLSPLSRHIIQVRREADGAELPGSPVVIEAADAFDADLRQTITNAVAAVGSNEDRDRVLSFILQQADRLLQQHADADARHADRFAQRQLRRRWGPLVELDAGSAEGATAPGLRALVIDERLPVAGRDAGSQAILSHMRALRRLGYEVSFVAADEMAPDDACATTLAATGVTCCAAPFYAAVEDVLRRQADCFDLVYLHRAGIATRYLGLARRYMKRARILYSVADLHHVRLERQAAVEARPELLAVSRRARLEECVAAWSADAVITHSADEADILRRLVPEASVHRVPWQVPERDASVPFAARGGVAFVGSYAHAPNVDAACWLVEAVMPLVWQTDPDIECLLVGSDMPAAVRRLAGSGVVALGQVAELAEVFDRVRLTVAPLRYGAGVKGKVLESLAAGVPCVMSPIAAEGLGLPKSLRALVGEDAAALAALVCRLHRDAGANRTAARAGWALIRANHAEAEVTAALQAAIEGRGQRTQSVKPRARGAAA